jgi:hypothetical protein
MVQLPPHKPMPRLENDSFQYLSAASQLRSTHRMATSLVYFDVERSHGTIPAPLTWFPPGYPLAIAAASTVGLSYEASSLSISIACFVVVTAGIWRLVRMLDPSRWVARVAVFCWLTNSYALKFSVSALSESMFTALSLAALLFLVHTGRKGAHNSGCWVGSATMAGASYWVRYAGVLWVGACFALLVSQLAAGVSKRRASLGSAIIAGVLLLLSVMPLMVRNMLLVGDWRGGNNTPSAMPIHNFVAGTPRILYHLIVGDGTTSQLWFPIALLVIGLIGLCVTATPAGFSGTENPGGAIREPFSQSSPRPNWGLVLAALLIYGAGISAIALRSVIAYSPRMYLPVLPHLLTLVVCGVASLARRAPKGAYSRTAVVALALGSLLGYAMCNVISSARMALEPDAYQKTNLALVGPDETGRSLNELLDQELKPGEVIAATNGQAAGYVLRHPTLSLAGRPYTLVTWNAPQLRAQLARYGAAHLLVFRNPELDSVVDQSPFLQGLAAGQSPPWLQPAGFNRDLYVYRVRISPLDEADTTPSEMAP